MLRCRWCFIGQIFTWCGHRCLYRTRRLCCWLQLSTDLDDAVRLLCGARVWPRNQSQTVTATWHSDRLEWGLIVENIGLMACYDPSVPLSSARLTDFWSSPAGGTWTTASPPGGTWSFFFNVDCWKFLKFNWIIVVNELGSLSRKWNELRRLARKRPGRWSTWSSSHWLRVPLWWNFPI